MNDNLENWLFNRLRELKESQEKNLLPPDEARELRKSLWDMNMKLTLKDTTKIVTSENEKSNIDSKDHSSKVNNSNPKLQREEIFISYSHSDSEWLRMLQTHLKPLTRNKTISIWVDTRINAGMEWREEISKAISRAQVAVLLVSPNFLASDFIAENELPLLLDAAEKEGLSIIWVPLKYALYEETAIKKYQAAHSPNQPIASLNTSDQDRALVNICKKIKSVVTEP